MNTASVLANTLEGGWCGWWSPLRRAAPRPPSCQTVRADNSENPGACMTQAQTRAPTRRRVRRARQLHRAVHHPGLRHRVRQHRGHDGRQRAQRLRQLRLPDRLHVRVHLPVRRIVHLQQLEQQHQHVVVVEQRHHVDRLQQLRQGPGSNPTLGSGGAGARARAPAPTVRGAGLDGRGRLRGKAANGSNNQSSGCSVASEGPTPAAPVSLAGILLGAALALSRRRRARRPEIVRSHLKPRTATRRGAEARRRTASECSPKGREGTQGPGCSFPCLTPMAPAPPWALNAGVSTSIRTARVSKRTLGRRPRVRLLTRGRKRCADRANALAPLRSPGPCSPACQPSVHPDVTRLTHDESTSLRP